MSSLFAKLALSLLSVGGITTAVAVPTLLTSKGEETKVTKELEGNKQLKEQDKEKTEEFKKRCFGGFLKEEGKGELIFCEEKPNGKYTLNFYLRWTEKEAQDFDLIKEKGLEVGFYKTDKWEVWFNLENKNRKKKITVNRKGLEKLNEISHQSLKEKCKKDKDSDSLTCSYTDHLRQKHSFKIQVKEELVN